MRNHPLRGNLVENLVVAEVIKHRFNAGRRANCGLYRDSTGIEVRAIYSIGPRLVSIAIKASQTIAADFFKGFAAFDSIMDQVAARLLVYAGNKRQRRTTAEVVGYRQLPKVLCRLFAE